MAKLSADVAGERAADVYMGVDVFGRNTFGGGGFKVQFPSPFIPNLTFLSTFFALRCQD